MPSPHKNAQPQARGDHKKCYNCFHLHCGKSFVDINPKQINFWGETLLQSGLRITHLGAELVKRHDRPKEEEREVEVVLEEVEDGVDALFPLTALEGEAHAAHDGEGATSIEKDILEIKSSCHKPTLDKRERVTTRSCLALWGTLLLGWSRHKE